MGTGGTDLTGSLPPKSRRLPEMPRAASGRAGELLAEEQKYVGFLEDMIISSLAVSGAVTAVLRARTGAPSKMRAEWADYLSALDDLGKKWKRGIEACVGSTPS